MAHRPTTMELNETQQNALHILMDESTSAKPISAAELSRRVALSAKGRIRIKSIIHELRKKGLPICSASSGYFYARIDHDLERHLLKLRNKIDFLIEEKTGLEISFHRIESNEPPTIKLATRTAEGSVLYRDFPVDEKGTPIVPEGTQLI